MQLTRIGTKNQEAFRELMSKDCFMQLQEDSFITGLGVIEDGYACGALMFRKKQSILEIVSYYIHPDYRNLGFATCLMEALLDFCKKIKNIKIIFGIYREWEKEQKIGSFLSKRGWQLQDSNTDTYSFQLEDLRKLSYFKRIDEKIATTHIHSFGEVPASLIREFCMTMKKKEMNFMGKKILSGDIHANLSKVYIRDGKILSFAAVTKIEDALILEWLYTTKGYSNILFSMILEVAREALCMCSEKTRVYITTIHEESKKLLQGMIGDIIQFEEKKIAGVYLVN